jgi:hypothetical protein
MTDTNQDMVTLAVYLNSRGFSFVLFEGMLSPYDWGILELRGPRRDASCLRKMTELLDRYDVDALVIQDTGPDGTRRASRLLMLNTALEAAAGKNGVPVFKYSRAAVYMTFATTGFTNKQTLAELIAKHIPAFERHVPPPRKQWISEDARMGLFDAPALALVFLSKGTAKRVSIILMRSYLSRSLDQAVNLFERNASCSPVHLTTWRLIWCLLFDLMARSYPSWSTKQFLSELKCQTTARWLVPPRGLRWRRQTVERFRGMIHLIE